MKTEGKHLSTTQAAALLGISRVAVFKRIRAGTLKAHRVGGRYLVEAGQLGFLQEALDPATKRRLRTAVDRTFAEYGDVLKKLGGE